MIVTVFNFGYRRKKRFKAEIQVKYHRVRDTAVSRREQLNSELISDDVDEQDHDDYDVGNALSVADCAEHSDISDEPETSTTRHYQRLQRAEDAWSKLRQPALATTFQKEGSFFTSNRCHFCDSEAGICRCLDCSATARFCESCAISMHSKINIFHRVEILKVRILIKLSPLYNITS